MNADFTGSAARHHDQEDSRTNFTKPQLVVALDMPDASRALALAAELGRLPLWIKLGLELFTVAGPDLVRAMRELGFNVFLDLKFHDIPNTVKGAVCSSALLGVDMCTLHACGGEDMCRAALEGRKEAASMGQRTAGAGVPLLMAVTVLTSRAGDAEELRSLVVERALMAKRCGLDGVVCSGHEAAAVKKACGNNFLCLCPGIRFPGTDQAGRSDQARVCTPAQAVQAGADFLVMGRPITGAGNPMDAAGRALAEMG